MDTLGIYNVHIANSYGESGLPDRYLGRGFWIECKSILFTRKKTVGRPKHMAALLRKSQKRTIPKLIQNGDKVLVCIFCHTEDEPTRFKVLQHDAFNALTESELDKIAVPWGLTNERSITEVTNALQREGFPIPER